MVEFEKVVKCGDVEYIVEGGYTQKWVDDSFDHAFGTEHCGHWEVVDLWLKKVVIMYGEDYSEQPLDGYLASEIKSHLMETLDPN